jgi:hypothetical protein
MQCIIPLIVLLNNDKNRKIREKLEKQMKLKEELLNILAEEKLRLIQYPDDTGYYDIEDQTEKISNKE